MTSLSDMWVIEYEFATEAFSVRRLKEHLESVQRAFIEGRMTMAQVFAIHPTEEACRDECDTWQDRRDAAPLTKEDRTLELLRRCSAPVPQSLLEQAQTYSLTRGSYRR